MERKLAAIFSADVQGYSRLMGEDEEATVRTLTAYRDVMTSLIEQHRGRVVDAPGDNLLAEFASVVDAVQCAVATQHALKARNATLPAHRKMLFRIGINLGDVLVDGERIYGAGVNLAARMEGLAEGGGICLSGTAFDQVENRLPLVYAFLGEHTVKNIAKPVRVYRVEPASHTVAAIVPHVPKALRRPWRWVILVATVVFLVRVAVIAIWLRVSAPPMERASTERMTLPLPDKPSIAVLPFDNLSGNAAHDYLADGMAENLITALSKLSELFVIARNSTFTYKGKSVKVQHVSEELGVRYVLEGSVLTAGERVRVTAQLVDALQGHHLWSEQYDRDLLELFTLLDDITRKIVVALQVQLTEGEQARVRHRSTQNLQAWGFAVRAYSLFERFTNADNAKARELLEQALQLDPAYAWAWILLGYTHWVDARLGFSASRAVSLQRAAECARQGVALDETLPEAHSLLGQLHVARKQYDEAIAEGTKAITPAPNDSESHALLAEIMQFAGRFEGTVTLLKQAMRLHPFYPFWYLYRLGESYRFLGQHEEAIAAYEEIIRRQQHVGGRHLVAAHRHLASIYGEMGQEKEARTHLAEVLRLQPDFSLESARRFISREASFHKDPAFIERYLDGLRKAGLQ